MAFDPYLLLSRVVWSTPQYAHPHCADEKAEALEGQADQGHTRGTWPRILPFLSRLPSLCQHLLNVVLWVEIRPRVR